MPGRGSKHGKHHSFNKYLGERQGLPIKKQFEGAKHESADLKHGSESNANSLILEARKTSRYPKLVTSNSVTQVVTHT